MCRRDTTCWVTLGSDTMTADVVENRRLRANTVSLWHMYTGVNRTEDYAIGEKMSNNPLVNMTQLPMGGGSSWTVA